MKTVSLLGIITVVFSTLYAGDLPAVETDSNTGIWIALFALGVIGVVILFVFSRQVSKTEEDYKHIIDRQKEIEHKQTVFLSSITENIHEIVEHTYKEVSGQQKECLPETIVEKEKQLLNVTNDLIEFLRLKSKKVQVIKEQFNLNNVLNEVAGSVCSKFYGSRADLVFDIDNNIPRYLVGDALHLERSLHNLLEYVLRTVPEGKIILSIVMFASDSKKVELQFRLSDTGSGLDKESLEKLFVPVYDEESKQYSGLGLFVAKELIELMEGDIVAQSNVGKGTTFTVTLPLGLAEPENRRNYHLPEKELTEKKVFIVDNDYDSSVAIKKMFTYFKHHVKVMDRNLFLQKKVDLSGYDIVILDQSIFAYKKIYNYLEQIKAKHKTKIVGLDTLLRDPAKKKHYDIIDRNLSKPLSQERVFELIVNLYAKQQERTETTKGTVDAPEQKIPVHSGEIDEVPNITQQSFSEFRGKRLLIVEDVEINQKVLSNVLKLSGMDITFANNGRIAVNTIKESDTMFDMVLMDINMPVLDGYAATQMIRKESRYDTLPIVAFTALALESEKEKIFKSGMNAYMTKPLNIGKLYSVFRMFMTPAEHVAVASQSEPKRSNRKDVLDIDKGVAYSNYNEGFYMEILKEFLDAYGNSAEQFEKLVREQRYEQIKMLCVDMKGLTGTIGAGEMYMLVMKIHHQVLYRQEEILTDYIVPYRETLQHLKDEINTYLSA